MDLSVIIPTYNEAANIPVLIGKINEIFQKTNYQYEVIVVDKGSTDNTLEIARGMGALAFAQKLPGYGGALKEAIHSAKGEYIITMDADLSHNPYVIRRLFSLRHSAHIVIASRYIRGGLANTSASRRILSIILNRFLASGLSLPLKDISSGFRLYRREIFQEIDFSAPDFNVLAEIVILAYLHGFKVKETPFHYYPRAGGRSHAKIVKFGLGFLCTFLKMWRLRNSIYAADYDERAFYSRIPMQRYWQRKRYQIIIGFVGFTGRVLDAGCGSSKILGALPQAIGLDINFRKLRYSLSLGNQLVNSDIRKLPFKDGVFQEVVCSEVIEHIPQEDVVFQELGRVLEKGGVLILGTPDYSRISWLVIEWLYKRIIPGGYADEHISHYDRRGLREKMHSMGFRLESYKYILGSELICKFRKEG